MKLDGHTILFTQFLDIASLLANYKPYDLFLEYKSCLDLMFGHRQQAFLPLRFQIYLWEFLVNEVIDYLKGFNN